MKWHYKAPIALFIISLAGGFIWNAGHNNALFRAAQDEIYGQRQVIARQAFDFNRFNQAAEFNRQHDVLIAVAGVEKKALNKVIYPK